MKKYIAVITAVVTLVISASAQLSTNRPVYAPYVPQGTSITLDSAVVVTNASGSAVTTVSKFTLYSVNVNPAAKTCTAMTDLGSVMIHKGADYDAHASDTLDAVVASLKSLIPAAVRNRYGR